jgi:hypothetical protein
VESTLGPLGTSAIYWPNVPGPGDCEDGGFGGMKIGRGNRSTRRKPAPAPLFPPQIPLHQTRARTRAAAVGSQRLTAWAMARPNLVGIATDYGWTTRRGGSSSPGRVKKFHFSISSKPALGSTQPPIKWVPGLFPRGYSGRGVKLTTHL